MPTYNFFDLAATYSFRDGLRLTLGVNNILDKDSQITPGLNANDYGPGFFGMSDGVVYLVMGGVETPEGFRGESGVLSLTSRLPP